MHGDMAGSGYLLAYCGELGADVRVLEDPVDDLPDLAAAAAKRPPDKAVLQWHQPWSLARRTLVREQTCTALCRIGAAAKISGWRRSFQLERSPARPRPYEYPHLDVPTGSMSEDRGGKTGLG